MAYTFNPFTSKLDYYIDPIYLPLAGGTMTGNIVMPAESYIGPTSTTGIYLKSGNVGIGTTSPGAKLDIEGTITEGQDIFNIKC